MVILHCEPDVASLPASRIGHGCTSKGRILWLPSNILEQKSQRSIVFGLNLTGGAIDISSS